MQIHKYENCGFKPYYKWITFNTLVNGLLKLNGFIDVLNLIINGLPLIPAIELIRLLSVRVLNLIINGLPLIRKR